ncbi:MAG TPA: ferritin-like domain-containing protein [Geminicoccus sp.]|jgi:hypothetical protein|uniref:ferritin-like domain-containing protein n=1 Tax=Geminicoccus sp. TaxID=2024832 RepID=UPI002E341455|nr:ferritin-like domain-containing protein [Geminicoccus sp.]HEX2527888.1 ferritin-like domain-containing protein [Geminicoccus sp.]
MTETATPAGTDRRGLMARTLGLASAIGLGGGSLLASATPASAQAITELDVLNFALNLEYLEAEFYLRAVYGSGLPPGEVSAGSQPVGTVTGGHQVSFGAKFQREIAMEIAQDERAHVTLLRGVLGNAKVARPRIDFQSSFTALARASGVIGPSGSFDPFATEENFWLGAFVFEDVGVTAYKGATPALASSAYLEAAAGLLAVEAYHAGEIRTLLLRAGKGFLGNRIGRARNAIDGPTETDQGPTANSRVNIVPTDQNGLAFSRTPRQVLDVVYLGTNATKGGFFPNGMNGKIR